MSRSVSRLFTAARIPDPAPQLRLIQYPSDTSEEVPTAVDQRQRLGYATHRQFSADYIDES